MITVKELREQLAFIPDDTPIILQDDDEGNGFRYMNGIDFSAEGEPDANFFDGRRSCVTQSDRDYLEEGDSVENIEHTQLVAVVY